MTRKFAIKGDPTYRYYMIREVFEPEEMTKARWTDEIMSKLEDSKPRWEIAVNHSPTQLSYRNISLRKMVYYPQGPMMVTIGMFRDGFHIQFGLEDVRGTSDIKKDVFGDVNWFGAWTQEVAKVAPITNEILNAIRNYLKDKPSR